MIASSPTARVRFLALTAATAALVPVAGCDSTPLAARGAAVVPSGVEDLPPSSRLAASAALAQDQYYSASYRFVPTGGGASSLRVDRVRNGFSLELTEPASASHGRRVTASVTNDSGSFRCRVTESAGACVPGAGAGASETDALSRVRAAFTTWLKVLADRSAALSVTAAPNPSGVAGRCFSVEGVAAALEPPVDPGLYCFDQRGLLTAAELPAGSLSLTADGPALAAITLPAPVAQELPAAEEPRPEPSETASPAKKTGVSPAPSVTPKV